MQCLSSVFLSRGSTQATFALLGKMLYLKLLFIAIDRGVLKGSAAILISQTANIKLSNKWIFEIV